jgi:histidinol-phosphate/aromatic aminotransferase/cobyric acid decarboxylase-like protein
VRYWGSRPDLWTKLRITIGQRSSNEKFVGIVQKALAEDDGAAVKRPRNV